MKYYTYARTNVFKNPPHGVQIVPEWREYSNEFKISFDIDNLEHVNFVRRCDGKSEIGSLNGYCMSTGCSCRHPNGSKTIPHCGLFQSYDQSGIKKDFIYQIFGI